MPENRCQSSGSSALRHQFNHLFDVVTPHTGLSAQALTHMQYLKAKTFSAYRFSGVVYSGRHFRVDILAMDSLKSPFDDEEVSDGLTKVSL